MKAKMTVYQKGGKMPIVPDPKKKNVPVPNNKPNGLYFESKNGRVGRTRPLYDALGGTAVELQSMDTTGYGAGRQDFKLETSKPGFKSSTPVKREDVLKTINKLKSGASKVAKFNNGGKLPKKEVPDHLKSDAAKLSSTPSEVKVSQLKSQQGREMKDYKAAGRVGADQSGIFEGMKATNSKLREAEAKAKAERAAKEKARASYMPKYAGGGKVNVAGAKASDVYKYLGYGKKK